jgi:IS5 family transposase
MFDEINRHLTSHELIPSEKYFSMKMHIGVDDELGLLHSLTCAPANVHDIAEAGSAAEHQEKAKASIHAKVEYHFYGSHVWLQQSPIS